MVLLLRQGNPARVLFQFAVTKEAIKTWREDGPEATTRVYLNAAGHFEVKHILWHRALCMGIFVSLPRFLIVMVLSFSGVRFLTTITKLEDIILNAVALEAVLTVDKLIFRALAPEVVQTVPDASLTYLT